MVVNIELAGKGRHMCSLQTDLSCLLLLSLQRLGLSLHHQFVDGNSINQNAMQIGSLGILKPLITKLSNLGEMLYKQSWHQKRELCTVNSNNSELNNGKYTFAIL